MNFNKKLKFPKVNTDKNYNLISEYEKSIEHNKTHYTSTTRSGVMYCIDKYKPETIFAMYVKINN